MKMPKAHIADETLARIAYAAARTQPNTQAAAPASPDLVEYTGDEELAMPASAPAPQEAAAQPAPAGGDVPGIQESGLDMGALLGGADSFDAMLGSISK